MTWMPEICIDRQTWLVKKLKSSHCSLTVLCGPSTKVDALTNHDTSSHLMLSISVRPLTHRCAPWSQCRPCSQGSHCHCSRGAHRHGSHCHPSLSNLCTGGEKIITVCFFQNWMHLFFNHCVTGDPFCSSCFSTCSNLLLWHERRQTPLNFKCNLFVVYWCMLYLVLVWESFEDALESTPAPIT